MKNKKCIEQKYHKRAIFYGALIHNTTYTEREVDPISYQKTWLMFAGLIESSDMIKYNDE